jgi:hypothetical protein
MRPGFLPGLAIGLFAGILLAMAMNLMPEVSVLRTQNRALAIKLQNLQKRSAPDESRLSLEPSSDRPHGPRRAVVILALSREPGFLPQPRPDYGPIAVLWDDGTVLRCQSDAEIGTHYVKGQLDPQLAKKLEVELYRLATTPGLRPGDGVGIHSPSEDLSIRDANLSWEVPFPKNGWAAGIHKCLLEASLRGARKLEGVVVMDRWRAGKFAVGKGLFADQPGTHGK